MAPHAITLHIQISAADYADATRLLKAGNLNANPLTLALLGTSAYALVTCTVDRITLRQVIGGRHYSGPMPTLLAAYLAGFQRGVRVFESRQFELLLESHGG